MHHINFVCRVGNDENWSQERILFRDESACSLLPPEPMLRNETLTPKVHSDSMVLISKDDVSQLHTLHTNLLGYFFFSIINYICTFISNFKFND